MSSGSRNKSRLTGGSVKPKDTMEPLNVRTSTPMTDIQKNQAEIEQLQAKLAEAKFRKAKRKLEEKAGHSGDVGSKKDKLQEVIPSLVDKDKVRAVEKDTSEEEVMEVYAQVIRSDQEFPQPTPPGPQVTQPRMDVDAAKNIPKKSAGPEGLPTVAQINTTTDQTPTVVIGLTDVMHALEDIKGDLREINVRLAKQEEENALLRHLMSDSLSQHTPIFHRLRDMLVEQTIRLELLGVKMDDLGEKMDESSDSLGDEGDDRSGDQDGDDDDGSDEKGEDNGDDDIEMGVNESSQQVIE